MWSAKNLPLECRLLTAPCDCVGDGDLAEACRPALVCLHSTGRSWQPGNLESVTFKIHFVTLVNKKWQTEESWKKMIHSCADSWEQLWPGSKASWVDQKLCYGMTGLALQVLQLEAACGRRGHQLPGSPFYTCLFRSVLHSLNSDKLPDSLL